MDTTFQAEDKYTFSQLLKMHPALKCVTCRTMVRWTRRATRGHTLASIKVGGRTMTSLGAVDRFLAAINSTPSAPEGVPRSPQQRNLASRRDGQELTSIGA